MAPVCLFVTFFAVLVACNNTDQGPRSTLTADQAAAARQACTFTSGTLPGLSLAKDATIGSDMPIDTIVIMMMENRSFDHMLQNLPAFGQPDAEVAPPGVSNPDDDAAKTPVPQFHNPSYCFEDTEHGWTAVHTEWDNGLMDGFVHANNLSSPGSDGKRAMGYYTEADIPFFYSLASTFALADHNFSSVIGPTFPNREYLYAATSFGHIGNDVFADDEMPTIFQELVAAKVDWRIYYTDLPGSFIFLATLSKYLDNTYKINNFFMDAQAGTLGQVNFVDPKLGLGGASRNDYHPPGDVQMGDKLVSDVVQALMASPQWKHTALIITFDEHGGLYDHVAPPKACPPDNIAPMTTANDNAPGGFDNYSVRVPLIVVSPYAKPHFVSHAVYDHTSITRFVETRFKLAALTGRDANADPLTDLFDFKKAAFATPPSLPAPTLDQAKLDDCIQQFPDDGGVGYVPDMATH
jgi:phospholipase C